MTAKEAGELLDLIETRAPKLRAAGVRGEVQIDNVRFSIGEAAAVASDDDDDREDEDEDEYSDPLKDPATFGIRGKQPIPGVRPRSKS